ncbi:MAG: hypothetical protein WCL07_04545 [bacterium]
MAKDPEKPPVKGIGDGGDDELRKLLAAFSAMGNGLYDTTINRKDAEEGIAGLQSNTGIQIINLGRKYQYRDEPRLFADETGQLSDWRDRFDKPGHIFGSGERVVVPAYVEVSQDGDLSMVADDQDGRMADVFHLSDLDPDVRKTLLDNRGLALGCIVNINGLRQTTSQLSDIHEYDAKIENRILIPPINPTPEQIANLPKGYRVIVEGLVEETGFDKSLHYGHFIDEAYLVVVAPDGRKIKLPSWKREKINYNGGTIGNIKGKQVGVGERIRVTGYIDQTPLGNTLHGHYSEPYMVEGTQDRLEKYSELRESISRRARRLSEMVDGGDYRSARLLFAQLRTEELLEGEGLQIIAIRDGIPEEDRPIYDEYVNGRQYWARSVDEAYGVMTESMTKSEYIDFVRSVVSGGLVQSGPECDASYLYLIMAHNEYDTDTWTSVLSGAIDTQFASLEEAPDEIDDYHTQKFLLEQSISYLSSVKNVKATGKILDFVRNVMAHKYYDKRQNRDDDHQLPYKYFHLLYKGTEGLARSVKVDAGNLDAIADLDEIMSWKDELSAFPFNYTMVDHLSEVIDKFSIA